MNRLLALLIAAGVIAAHTLALAEPPAYTPIPVQGFEDGVKHYRDASGETEYARYAVEDIVAIADNVLLHQRSNGGWRSNWDPLRILSEEEVQEVLADRAREDTTLDNRATYPHIEYLAHAYNQTGDTRYRDAALRGLDFIFEAECEPGGWPHSYPNTRGYRGHITFMDDVTTGVLHTLRKAADGLEPFAFLPDDIREQAAGAVARGDALILRLQIIVDGTPTAWGGQYDRDSLEPAQGRAYELPSIVSAESVGVVRYLMSIEPPTPGIVRAIDHAIAWYERSAIHGIRIESIPIEPIRYDHHTATTDRIVVEDPDAPPIWARFYEIDTNRPFMANRDGIKVYSLAEVHHERRTGYGWYTLSPAGLVHRQYPAWRARWEAALPELFDGP